jgi:hypothetical protein
VGESLVSVYPLFNIVQGEVQGLSRMQNLAIYAEDILRYVAKVMREADTTTESGLIAKKKAKRYFRNLQILQYTRAVWDAIMMAYQAVRERCQRRGEIWMLKSRTTRAVKRFKVFLLKDPESAAKLLKKLAGAARGWHFGRERPVSSLFTSCGEKWMGLTVSYMSRALPAPLTADGSGIVELVARLTSLPIPEVSSWRPFVHRLFVTLQNKKAPTANLRTQPSGHAALGYSRHEGGHASAISTLTSIGYMLKQGIRPWEDSDTSESPELYKKSFFDFQSRDASGVAIGKPGLEQIKPEDLTYDELLSMTVSGTQHQSALVEGCMWVLSQVDYVPVMPIEAGEKGIKTRFPTCSLTACNLIQQILRRVIDHILINDPRMSEGIGGTKVPSFRKGKDFYSQDMSFATDLHPHWLTRVVYEELAGFDGRLKKYLPYYDKIFGPKRMLVHIDPPICDVSKIDYQFGDPILAPELSAPPLPPGLMATAPDWDSGRLTLRGRIPIGSVASAMLFLRDYRDWLQNVTSPSLGPLTTKGAMMGDPTSFPVMPMMSAYAAESVHHHPKDGMLTGDDAAYSGFPQAKVAQYNASMESLGGTISTSKSEWHREKALFCEVPFYRGVAQKFSFLSYWVAPPGGSKGSINWVSQSLTVVADNRTQGKRRSEGLWEFSPLWRMQQAAFLMGLPMGAPPEFGGVLHPRFPAASRSDHLRWLTYLSGLSSTQLVSGTGLAVMPSPYQHLRSAGAKKVQELVDKNKAAILAYDLQLETYSLLGGDLAELTVPRPLVTDRAYGVSGQQLPSIEETCDQAAAPLIAWELYFRAPIIAESAPSIRKAVRRFRHRVSKSPPIYGKYSNVKLDVARKQAVYVGRSAILGSTRYSAYGLEKSNLPKRTVLKHWAPGRVDWR